MPWALKGTKKRQLKEAVLERDGPDCHWCGVETIPVPSGHEGPLLDGHRTLDHVLRRREGGPDEAANLVIACNLCNKRDRAETCGAGLLTEADLEDLLA
jgi:5-methylcytosine-specific restriction endonuclease McrA